ncbi:hypothetical protein HanHA300_Chr01g0007861 [Helianthus annuus]|nr:hypothetical protein HanHA300_Chr01g0007861 [Helianthus annuus]KAJ0621608.1 hypothetical protein HanIR_Chr01g0010631 [Helianthus annuus]
MPMVWRVLTVLNQIKTFHFPDLCIEDIPIAYRLRSYGNSRFLLFSTSNNPLILKVTKNEDEWKRKFFFVRRDSIAEGNSLPVKWLTTDPVKLPQVFDLEELDSYSAPVQVKKEPSKPSTVSKPATSSKATAMPKPSPATKPCASNSRKRKETDSPATSEAFSYKNHGFLEFSGFMTSFLNQGLERLTNLYEEACGVNKMLEARLKKA